MEQKKKLLKTISVIELIVGIVYFIEGLIVATGKSSYFLSGAITAVTAVLCYLAADDRSKAQPAKMLLWASIILSAVGVIIALVSRENIMSIITVVIDICIAVYIVRLIKEIHG